MGKKSKKKRRKRLSSSSSEEDEVAFSSDNYRCLEQWVSKEQDVTKKCKSAKRKQDVNSQESCAKWETRAFCPIKDVSQSIRQIKKPVYRLAKTQATDQKPHNKEEECTKTKSVSSPFHRGNCSSKAKDYISGNNYTVSGSKTVERPSSKPLNTSNADAARKRKEEMSKGCLDEKSSKRSPSKLKKLRMSPSLGSAEQKEQAQNVLTRNCRAVDPPRTGKESRTIKTKESSKTSKDFSWQKTGELFKCQRHQENKLKATRNLCNEAKAPSASTTKLSFTLAKHTTSVSTSNAAKNVTSSPGNVNLGSHITAKPSSAQQKICYTSSYLPLTFKIPKKVYPRPVDSPGDKNDAISVNGNLKHGTELSMSGASVNNSKQETNAEAHSCLDVTPSFSCERRDKMSSLSGRLPPVFDAVTEPWYGEMQVVEELHLARCEKRLEVNVLQSYGELTYTDIDLPEEGAADTHCKQPPQQDLILVLDTNILLSHLDYVKRIRSHGLGAMGFPVVLIPWVVLQEMDSLKKGRGLSYSVAHLAIPAISYIYNSLRSREPHLLGQSMQQAAESSHGLKAENNDDRVLQCCLQYQSLYPECALILCTNDKNLCSKAMLSGVKALSKNDLEAEFRRTGHGVHVLQNAKTSVLPHISPQVSSPMLSTNYSSLQPHSHERTGLSVEPEKDKKQQSKIEDEESISTCVSELGDCLREVLSDVLEVEMKAAYEDLWQEIVCRKPPWTLQDVLHCLKKHWIAVFGHIVPRRTLQTVVHLIDFFNSGKTVDRSSTLSALQEAKKLVKTFEKSSSHAPSAFSIMDNIFNKLQPQDESPAGDVVMNDDCNEDKQAKSTQVCHQEVWALFENIWNNVFQKSMEVFKALGFDPHTMQSTETMGSHAPPQDALVYLHKLSTMVSQLLNAFSSVLSSTPGSEEVQTLLSIIHCQLEFHIPDSRLTTKHLLDCFSQPDYREKLRVGGNQLMELKVALDHCVGTFGQHITFTT